MRKCSFDPMCISPFIQKINLKCKTNTHVYLQILHAHTKFREKWIFFVACAKNTKKMCREKAYFNTAFCHFYIDYINGRFFLKRLRGHVERQDVYITFLFGIF
jgi:hypothetical protein